LFTPNEKREKVENDKLVLGDSSERKPWRPHHAQKPRQGQGSVRVLFPRIDVEAGRSVAVPQSRMQ